MICVTKFWKFFFQKNYPPLRKKNYCLKIIWKNFWHLYKLYNNYVTIISILMMQFHQCSTKIFVYFVIKSSWSVLIDLLSPRNSVGGDIVTRPFVGGWVSESVSGFVSGSVTLYLVDTIATTVFALSLSNFTCTFAMMRGGTLLILDHGVKGQGQLWHSVYKTLWAR